MYINALLLSLFSLAFFRGCSTSKSDDIIGEWQSTEIAYRLSNGEIRSRRNYSYRLVLDKNGEAYFLNTEAALFDSADWSREKNTLMFSKPIFSYHNNPNQEEASVLTIKDVDSLSFTVTRIIKSKDVIDSIDIVFVRKVMPQKDMIREFELSKYLIQDHIRNRDQVDVLRQIAKNVTLDQYDEEIYLTVDSLVNTIGSWRYQIPTTSGGYRYDYAPDVYHSPNAKVLLLNSQVKNVDEVIRLYNKLIVRDSTLYHRIGPLKDSTKLRSFFSRFSQTQFYDRIKKTPYKITVKGKDDTVIQLLNDITQTQTSLLLWGIDMMTKRRKMLDNDK